MSFFSALLTLWLTAGNGRGLLPRTGEGARRKIGAGSPRYSKQPLSCKEEKPLDCSFLEADWHHSVASHSERPAQSKETWAAQRLLPPPEKEHEAVGLHSKLPKAESHNKITVSYLKKATGAFWGGNNKNTESSNREFEGDTGKNFLNWRHRHDIIFAQLPFCWLLPWQSGFRAEQAQATHIHPQNCWHTPLAGRATRNGIWDNVSLLSESSGRHTSYLSATANEKCTCK